MVDAKGLLTLTVELDPDQFTLTLGASALLGLGLLVGLLLLLIHLESVLSSPCTVETVPSIFELPKRTCPF